MHADTVLEELKLRERQIEAVRCVSQALFANTNVEAMLCRTVAVAIEVLGADVGSVQLHDPVTDRLVFRCVIDPASARLTGQSYPITDGIGGLVFRTGRGVITEHAGEHEHFNSSIDQLTGYSTDSLLTAPLCSFEGKCMGVMQVVNARRPFDESDLAVLETLAGHVATAIEWARLAIAERRAELISVVGDIAHDIKNMLTPLQSGMFTLQDMIETGIADTAEAGELCKSMLLLKESYNWILSGAFDSAERVQARTRDIANAVKGELSPPHFALEDATEVAREAVRALRPVAEAAGLRLCEAFDENLMPASLDHKQLFNALYNLINNAIQATPAGGTVAVETTGQENGYRIVVRDTGAGIEDEIKKRLFTAHAISTKPGGTGLGTRIVADVVRRHGGTVSVESEVGRGSAFILRMPLKQL